MVSEVGCIYFTQGHLIMATLHLPTPKPLLLTGNVDQNFKLFEQSFRIYLIVSGFDSKPMERQGNVLLHVMGEDALKIYNGFT